MTIHDKNLFWFGAFNFTYGIVMLCIPVFFRVPGPWWLFDVGAFICLVPFGAIPMSEAVS
jgi:hypothetical protein